MSIVLKRLEKRLIQSLKQEFEETPDDLDWFEKNNRKSDGSLSWFFFRLGKSNDSDFEKNLTEKQKDINGVARKALSKILVQEDASLSMEYGAYRSFLRSSLQVYHDELTAGADYSPKNTEETTHQVYELLDLSILLEQKYTYLINPTTITIERLQKDQKEAISWLGNHGYGIGKINNSYPLIDKTTVAIKTDLPGSATVRDITEKTNKYRLFLARFWRFLRLFVAYLQNSYYTGLMFLANPIASMTILYVAIVFFIPRMITTISNLLKHVFLNKNMSKEEKELGFWLRFNAQWMRLWSDASNDAAWITNGILQLVYFVGPLLPFVIFLSVATCAYDLATACLRFALRTYQFDQLTQEYRNISSYEQPMDSYLIHLNNRITQEKRMLYLNVFNFFVLFVGMGLALPWIIVFNPVLPLVGAVMAVFITLVNFGAREHFKNKGNKAAQQFNTELSNLLLAPKSSTEADNRTPIKKEMDPNSIATPNTPPSFIKQASSKWFDFFSSSKSSQAPKSPASIANNSSGELQWFQPTPMKKQLSNSLVGLPLDDNDTEDNENETEMTPLLTDHEIKHNDISSIFQS